MDLGGFDPCHGCGKFRNTQLRLETLSITVDSCYALKYVASELECPMLPQADLRQHAAISSGSINSSKELQTLSSPAPSVSVVW